MKYFAVLLFSAVLFVACGDESSSSAPAPDPSGESSSTVEMAKESSSSAATKNSSSSVDGDKSSSSVKKEDSSSSVVNESSSSATPKSSSSEEVKQSSSSVVASSSSEEEELSSSSYDRTIAFKGVLWRAGDYIKFVDPRNSREYYYIQIDGKDTAGKAASIKVMAENLDIGEFVWGFEDQEDDSKIEKYCYKNDTANCNNYGGLYQWAEMMQLPSRCNTESCADLIKPNHQGICPDGWRLLTYNDYYIAVHANNNKDGVKGTRSAYGFGGSNDSGFSLIGAGSSWNHSFSGLNDNTYWFYPVESSVGGDQFVHASFQYSTAKGNPDEEVYKIHGFSVRCVMVE
ncbi:FISUMP domain-containing protein [Fibrobacter sp. UWB10]|uniref:FISUMP domain-containing protein n=1 Tax=Fibrobacter sp. UWB10 TaxID=1896201 RepID=UPI002402F8BC|nr:FISUMP domain-containing protein [Fibrobacter sp. UWB10]SMP46935.1 major paralogous domain-containing protein [Fibrobacter sp. UWB10]